MNPVRRSLAPAWSVVAACALAALSPSGALAGPNGPRFGSATIGSEIRTAHGEADEDVYVESLALGETLQVRVAAGKSSALLPLVTVEGPDGLPRPVELKVKKGGRLLQSKKLRIDATGRWAVRIRGDAETEGSYVAKFKIGRQKTQTFKNVAVGGDAGVNVTQLFEAVEGAVANISVKSGKKGTDARFALVLDPGGGSVAEAAERIRSKGGKGSVKKLTLGDGDGGYGVLVSAPEGPATATVKISLAPPKDRPRGKLAISPEEPYLVPVDEPLEGFAGKSFPLSGANLDSTPRPEVWFGDRRASVVSASTGGGTLSVVPPDFDTGTTIPVEVIAPDGQAVRREVYFSYLEPEDDGPPPATLKLSSITPPSLAIDGTQSQVFLVTLDDEAPDGGVVVNIAPTDGIGQVPPTVRIATDRRSASFLFRAVNADVSGFIQASFNGSSASARITVREIIDVPPPGDDEIDISGWRVEQQNSSRFITIPQGTVLKKGDYLVVGRNAAKAQFEAAWGVTLGSNVIYIDAATTSGTEIPAINGGESFELYDAFGTLVDGRTIAFSSSAKQNAQRTPGSDPSQTSSWTLRSTPNSVANPGSGISTTAANNGIYISEFSDRENMPPIVNQYLYEFVELYYDGEAE